MCEGREGDRGRGEVKGMEIVKRDAEGSGEAEGRTGSMNKSSLRETEM